MRIVNAREHNLKALDVDIPHGKFNVITGVSGSGKSTLAFDILFHGPAPLPRIAERVCTLDRAAGRPPRSRCGVRHSADRRDRAAAVARRAQEHGRDHVRSLALPAAAVREARPAALHPRRHARHVAVRRIDRRAVAARSSRRARRAARAARRQPQGRMRISRSGRRRAAARICASMASSCRSIRGRSSTASASIRSSCRWPTSSCRRTTRPNCGACSTRRSSSARA